MIMQSKTCYGWPQEHILGSVSVTGTSPILSRLKQPEKQQNRSLLTKTMFILASVFILLLMSSDAFGGASVRIQIGKEVKGYHRSKQHSPKEHRKYTHNRHHWGHYPRYWYYSGGYSTREVIVEKVQEPVYIQPPEPEVKTVINWIPEKREKQWIPQHEDCGVKQEIVNGYKKFSTDFENCTIVPGHYEMVVVQQGYYKEEVVK